MVGRVAAAPGPLEHQRQLLADPGLADELGEVAGPQAGLDLELLGSAAGVSSLTPANPIMHPRLVRHDGHMWRTCHTNA